MRLIDADALKFEVFLSEENISLNPAYSEDYKRGWNQAMKSAMKEVTNAPIVELDRPRGEWVFKNDNPLIPTGYWECSICKTGRLMVEENFCPNCGAKMQANDEQVTGKLNEEPKDSHAEYWNSIGEQKEGDEK